MGEAASRVESWLRSDVDVETDDGRGTEAEFAALPRSGASEYGADFDEEMYILREEPAVVVRADVKDAAVVEDALGAVAHGAQRKAVCAFHRSFFRGRMLQVPRYGNEDVRNQRYYRLESFIQLSSLEDSALVDQLMKGVVRTRLGAHTGMGKTMKLPGLLAAKCGLRVCQLELDNHVAKAAMKYQRELYGIPGGVSSWSRQKKSFLAAMSYDEFRGIVLSGNRERLFSDFDLFYMDEAHEPLAVVWAARQYFATYAQPHNSLVVASATISSNADNNVAASNVGKFKMEKETLGLDEVMDSGALLGQHLRDRALVLVACDEDVALLRSYYIENGIDVCVLDSASTDEDHAVVMRTFRPVSAVVPRILVATQEYGTSYNLPVTYVVSTCSRRVFEMDANNALVEKRIPLMQKQVVQHQGRVNRGVTTGGGGWLLSSQVSPDKELLASEALEAYLSLIAAAIKPQKDVFPESVTRVLPKGMDMHVAKLVLSVGLPPALTVRYLGTDGLFAAEFAPALALFAQKGEVFRRSADRFPVGYDQWIDEKVGRYYLGDESDTSVTVRVPFESPAGLKIVMHAISAVSVGLLDMEYWDFFDNDDESEDEYTGVRTKAKRVAKPRVPEITVQPVVMPSVTSESSVWAYDVDPKGAVKRERRRGMSWDALGEGKVAMLSLVRAIEQGKLGRSVAHPQLDVPEYGGKVAYSLPLDENVEVPVSSPGGGKIMLMQRSVHDKFMDGSSLDAAEAEAVLSHLVDIRAVQRFAKSTVFDNWSPAWLCWFSTYADKEVIEKWKVKGLHSQAVKLLGYLYDRFRAEVITVCLSSNMYKDRLRSFFSKKPSISRLVKSARNGSLPVAQSDAFVARVISIKERYDEALFALERVGVYAPSQVTAAQRALPLRDKRRQMPVIDEKFVSSAKMEFDDGISNDWRQ